MDYHSDRFTDCSLIALSDDDDPVALLPANIEGATLCSHRGLTYGGWLMPLKHFDGTTMLAVMNTACEWMRANGINELVYKAVPHIYHSYPAEEDLYALFRHGAQVVETNLSATIDLTHRLLPDRGSRSAANAARRAGVTVGASDDWAGYWALLEQLLNNRYGTHPVHTLDEILLLRERFPENICLRTAVLDGELVAGVVLYLTPMVTHCQYIGASPKGKEVKALSLLFDALITEATERGCRWFDFGISNEQHGRYLNEGLLQQKNRLGGRGIAYTTYLLELGVRS